uniref:ATP-dependent helicase n=1 Tax=Candidatus Electronema sp. TaxID=2698783 RepID=UPI004056430E
MHQTALFPVHEAPSEFDLRSWLDSLPPLPDSSVPSFDLSGLNDAQRTAVTHSGGPALVIAGAGSGKTRTLVHRVAWLINQGVSPESILLLTFTKKAAQEMLDRAAALSFQARRVHGGTFHSTANSILRRHGHNFGFDSDFSIIDQSDAEGIISLITSSLRLSGASRRFPSSRTVFSFFSSAVNKNCSIDEVIQQEKPHLIQFVDDLYLILDHYSVFKIKHNLMDYDDLLINLFRLLSESSKARLDICRYWHVLVDEYQDTNWLQSMLVKMLANEEGNVMSVGDDAQGIYSFRGADFQNIMRFPQQYSGCSVITLEENYRSTPQILAFTNAVIANMQEKFPKRLFTFLPDGPKPLLCAARNEAEEARWVIAKIRELIVSGTPAAEIAVLYRQGPHACKFELELATAGLHYEKWGGLKLTESAHIKDVTAFLRILVNPHDRLSWHRLLLQIDKIGPKTAEKILNTVCETEFPFAALQAYSENLQSGFAADLRLLADTLKDMRLPGLHPAYVFELAMRYYQPILERIHFEDHPARLRDLIRVHALAADYDDLRSFVDDFALNRPDPAAADQGLKLIASTIHSAKGKEFDAVFVLGLTENRFPSCGCGSPNYEEEQRLFYVACTRARRQLFLTWPEMIITPDRKHRLGDVSPFLRDIDPALYDTMEAMP